MGNHEIPATKIFGETLKSLRISKGCTLETLAEKLGVHKNFLTKWENHGVLPLASKLAEICTKLELNDAEKQQLTKAYVASIWRKAEVAVKRDAKEGNIEETGILATRQMLESNKGTISLESALKWHEKNRLEEVPAECVQPLAELAKVMLRAKPARDGQPTP